MDLVGFLVGARKRKIERERWVCDWIFRGFWANHQENRVHRRWNGEAEENDIDLDSDEI